MRMTEPMRRESARKLAERRQQVSDMANDLQIQNCRIIPVMNGAGVRLVHLDMLDDEVVDVDERQPLVIDTLSDFEFDQTVLADYYSIKDRCRAMHLAIRKVQPIVEQQAIKNFKNQVRELFS